MKTKSAYVAEFHNAWSAEIAAITKHNGISERAKERLRAFAVADVRDTVGALSDSTRSWEEEAGAWAAWAVWYRSWAASEAQRVLPGIVAECAIDRDARRQEAWRASKARAAKVVVARRVVDALAPGAPKTLGQLEAAIYPNSKAAKARRALRKLVAELEGLGVLGTQKGRDGVSRLALWRDLWPEDQAALVGM